VVSIQSPPTKEERGEFRFILKASNGEPNMARPNDLQPRGIGAVVVAFIWQWHAPCSSVVMVAQRDRQQD
jgi:hypothetical protein